MSGKDTILQRIAGACEGKDIAKILELNLDNSKSNGEPQGLDENFTSLTSLSMNSVGFTSLKNFPKLLQLKKLELSDNRISGSLSCLEELKSLTHLNLSGNNIKTIEALEPLASLPNLISLDLYDCEVTSKENYRQQVFKLLPGLKYLDNFDCDMKERNDSDDEESEDEVEAKDAENGDAPHQVENGVGSDDDDFEDEEDDEEDEEEDDDSGSEEDETYNLAYLNKDNIEVLMKIN